MEAKAEMGGLCYERCEEGRRGGRLEEEGRIQRRVEQTQKRRFISCGQDLNPEKGKNGKIECSMNGLFSRPTF